MRTSSSATLLAVASLLLAVCLPGCAKVARWQVARGPQPSVRVYRVSDAAQPGSAEVPGRVALSGARNEWVSFAVELKDLPPGAWQSLRLRALRRQSGDGRDAAVLPAEIEAYQ